MNDAFAAFGLLNWKPIIGALVLPPVPMLLLVLLAWRVRRRGAGPVMLWLAVLGLWLSHCEAVGYWLERRLQPPPALATSQLPELRRALASRNPVVLVLGGGVQALAPEYGEANLSDRSLQRLHYGLWLGRQLQAPVMVSGGNGRAQAGGPAEAAVAGRIAARDYARPLKWLESASGDTRENARMTLRHLKPEGITDLLLVTHGVHMPRALRAFEQEAHRTGFRGRLIPAPMGLAAPQASWVTQWMPSADGFTRVHEAMHEIVGLLAGA